MTIPELIYSRAINEGFTKEAACALLANAKTKDVAVLNLGIGGNCILRGGLGPTGATRFTRDIMQQEGFVRDQQKPDHGTCQIVSQDHSVSV